MRIFFAIRFAINRRGGFEGLVQNRTRVRNSQREKCNEGGSSLQARAIEEEKKIETTVNDA